MPTIVIETQKTQKLSLFILSHDALTVGKSHQKLELWNKIDSSIQLCNHWYIVGSSTACIVALHKKERRLYTANLGDSGFLVIRDEQVVHRSQEQQHYFNTPFQLAVAPPSQAGLVLSDRLVILYFIYQTREKYQIESPLSYWNVS